MVPSLVVAEYPFIRSFYLGKFLQKELLIVDSVKRLVAITHDSLMAITIARDPPSGFYRLATLRRDALK